MRPAPIQLTRCEMNNDYNLISAAKPLVKMANTPIQVLKKLDRGSKPCRDDKRDGTGIVPYYHAAMTALLN